MYRIQCSGEYTVIALCWLLAPLFIRVRDTHGVVVVMDLKFLFKGPLVLLLLLFLSF